MDSNINYGYIIVNDDFQALLKMASLCWIYSFQEIPN